MSQKDFTPARPFQAEGARVAITTCKICGAALLIDPSDDFDVMLIHETWHGRGEEKDPRAGVPRATWILVDPDTDFAFGAFFSSWDSAMFARDATPELEGFEPKKIQ